MSNTPEIGFNKPENLETATFAMGCFWSVDALFGSLEGVVRTRVGYAGGSTANPTYRNLADHIETVQLDFDPAMVSYQQLVDTFFQHHKPIGAAWKRQYMSAAFYHNEDQLTTLEKSMEREAITLGRKLFTALFPYQHFYLAEDRHQKYKLQRQPGILAEIRERYPSFGELVNATAAARLNGFLYGYGKREELEGKQELFGLSAESSRILLEQATLPKGVHC